jgi:7-cyano-7-deazaguanine synthase
MLDLAPKPKVVCAFSGGLDSTVLAASYKESDFDLVLVSVDYGQRHVKELQAAVEIAATLKARHILLPMGCLRDALAGSSLTSADVAVPDGHYTDESMKATVVPNRNAILLSICWGVAVSVGAETVATGVHSGDHPIYPDCRPEFIGVLEHALRLGTAGLTPKPIGLAAPFSQWTKAHIVKHGASILAPLRMTWSCYKGGERHCGTCGTCVERKEAFKLAGVHDPTEYDVAD